MAVVGKFGVHAEMDRTTKQPDGMCGDCHTRRAAIKCCGDILCLLHAYASRHSQHPSLWKVLDKAENANTQQAVLQLKDDAIADLEAELAQMEQAAARDTEDVMAMGENVSPGGAAGMKRRKFTPGAGNSEPQLIPAPFSRSTVFVGGLPPATPSGFVSEPSDGGGAGSSASGLPTFESVRRKAMQEARMKAESMARKETQAASKRHAAAGAAGRSMDELDSIADGDDDEKGSLDTHAVVFARRQSAPVSMFSHSKPQAAVAPQSAPPADAAADHRIANARSAATSSSLDHVADADISVAASNLGPSSVRYGVVTALAKALLDGTKSDIARRSVGNSSAAPGSDGSSELAILTSKAAQERSETFVLRPGAVNRFALDIEEALFGAAAEMEIGTTTAAGNSSKSNGSGVDEEYHVDGGADAGGVSIIASPPPAPAAQSSSSSDPGKEYRDRARALLAALRNPNNPLLRDRILSGQLAPSQLVRLSSVELAPEAVRAERLAAEAEAIRRAKADEAEDRLWLASDTPCPSCNSKDTGSMPTAGTRDIRKAEVWGTSSTDETIFRMRCNQCGHRWTSTNG